MVAAIFGWTLLVLGIAGTVLAPRPRKDTAPAMLWHHAGLFLVSLGAVIEAAALLFAAAGSIARLLLTAIAIGILGAGAVARWWPHTRP